MDEYDKHFLRVERLGELVVNDFGYLRPATLLFPQFAHNTIHMTLTLGACNCDNGTGIVHHATRLDKHREWINRLAKHILHPRSMRVILLIPLLRCKQHVLKLLEFMTGMPKVVKLELRPIPFAYPYYDGDDVPTLATWTSEQGLVQNREVIRQFRNKGPNTR